MKDSKLCLVCSQNKYKYKCPKCTVQQQNLFQKTADLSKYYFQSCGLGCFKTHKCEDYKQEKQQIEPISQDMDPIHKSNYVEDEDLRVPKSKLEQLKNCLTIQKIEKSLKLKKILQSCKLRETLLKIDNARSRLWELNNEMKTNQHFMEFTQLILGEMDMLNNNNEFL